MATLSPRLHAQATNPPPSTAEGRISMIKGAVEWRRAGAGDPSWQPARTNQVLHIGDEVHVPERGHLALILPDGSVAHFGELSQFKVEPRRPARAASGFSFSRGLLYFFHRGKPSDIDIRTRTGVAAVRGTEFHVEVEEDGRTILTMLDGEVELSNELGSLTLTNLQQGITEAGKGPVGSRVIQAVNVIQWALYYPAVLDPADLRLSVEENRALESSLDAYRSGDVLQALDRYPAGRTPSSSGEKVYLGALLLAVGDVRRMEEILETLDQAGSVGAAGDSNAALADALRQVVAAVKGQPRQPGRPPETASEWLAESYYRQSRASESQTNLVAALHAARAAVEKSPEFSFGWARVAELEFSFGRVPEAVAALDKSRELAPRNPAALALKGFLAGARNRIGEAIASFDQALAIDGALGNAWLGRGLCRIRQGQGQSGREDLLMAAALEPQRAVLRSYLGKAYSDAGDSRRAFKELRLAQMLDPNDPTAWFYLALLEQQQNRVNEGVRDMQRSQELNDNRRVYRSGMLLDQDRAVRSANLARLYADADLQDVAVREAGRAVAADYANYSAHAFLANSYEVERRANLSNFRFEELSLNEYLLANLLGPANGRLLAQPVTQLEYGQLFERNRLGIIANTEYFSRGAWHHSGAQYGTLDGSSYSLEAEYRDEPGERVNQDLVFRQLEAKFKQDITPDDSLYFHVIDYRASGGDTAQQFDATNIARTYRFEQNQSPTLLAGYHHQWSPQSHTLLLAGRLEGTLEHSEVQSLVLTLDRGRGTLNGLFPVEARQSYSSRVELYTVEAEQILITGPNSVIAGVRAQFRDQNVTSRVQDPNGFFLFLLGRTNPVTLQDESARSSAGAFYAYDYFSLSENLQIVGGVNLTHQSVPVNTGTAPVTSEHESESRLSPKAGMIWFVSSSSSIRASYTESLTGSGPGQSIRLEPVQVAGMPQSFRDPVPFSLIGELDGADVATSEVLWEGKFHDTYLSLGGQRIEAEKDRHLGLFLSDTSYILAPTPGLIREVVRFHEYALDFSAHQLLGKEWSFGAWYRLAYAQLKRSFPEYQGLGAGIFGAVPDHSEQRGWLHTLTLSGLYRHPCGFFGRAEGDFFAQDRERDGASIPGDTFWQANIVAGYRFWNQHAELAVGVLNVMDKDYRLDPINQYADLPRSRTFYARLLVNF